MVVVSGSNAGIMAKQLAETLGWAHHPLETRRFPDTEGYIRIPSETIEALRAEPVVLVSNTFPDSGIVETLLMLDAIQDVRGGRLQNLREIGPQTSLASEKVSFWPFRILAIPVRTSDSSPASQFLLVPSLKCSRPDATPWSSSIFMPQPS